jgi:hypothetical protein
MLKEKTGRESFYTDTERLSLQSRQSFSEKYCTNFPLAFGLTVFVLAVTAAVITTIVLQLKQNGNDNSNDPLKDGGCSHSLFSNLAALGTTLPTLAVFMECIEKEHSVMSSMYSQEIYETKQPTLIQRNDLREFMSSTFFSGIENNSCFSTLLLPSSVREIYQLWEYTENKIEYCMLIEKNATFASNGYQNRMSYGWPIVVRPKSVNFTSTSSYLHLSAPHIVSDPDTVSSAANLFVHTKALSYIAQTRVQDALPGYPTCLNDSQASGQTDGMNSIDELFYDLNLGIISWQFNTTIFDSNPPSPSPSIHPSCTTSNCGFLQWFGTSRSTCYDAYISIGSGNESDYSYSPPNPAVSIHDYFNSYTTIYDAHTPYSGDGCGLWGKGNLIGRYLNFVPTQQLCDINFAPIEYSQLYVSIEASPDLRVISDFSTAPLNLMGNAIKQTYDANKINV